MPGTLLSQEEIEIDTSEYMVYENNHSNMTFGRGTTYKDVLNFNLMVAASKLMEI
jgi:hypothetical protein